MEIMMAAKPKPTEKNNLEKLAETTKKADVELKEEDLKRVTGGGGEPPVVVDRT
jgi:hypothetical protein